MLEMQVITALKEAFKSKETWEAEYPDLSPFDDDQVLLQNWASTVQTHGILLAQLTASPQTRAELLAEMEGMVDRAPAWLDAHFEGEKVMTLELFMHGIAQTQAKQRAAIERVVAEQVDDPAAIEKMLAQAPIPEGTEERSALTHSVGAVMTAHSEALVELAYDLDTKSRSRSD